MVRRQRPPARPRLVHRLLRIKLVPPQQPLAGLYRSNDPKVIAEHLAQSRRAALDFWAVSWWGPNSATDRTLREAILEHPDAIALRYAVLYESTGRLGRFNRPRYDNLADDFAYLKEHVLRRPALPAHRRPARRFHLPVARILSRPRLGRARRGPQARRRRVHRRRRRVRSRLRAEWARAFDAVTAYDVYGQSTGPHKTTRRAIDVARDNYAQAKTAANSAGVAFVPAVAPGYNDRAVRDGHAGTPRYFIDEADSQEGDLFRAMIRVAALPNLDDRCGRVMMVTSFNEWYEDSQIEATVGTAPVTTADSSESKSHFTGGDRYVDYGDLYLDILKDAAHGKAAK